MAENRRSGLNPQAYLGVEASTPPQFVYFRRNPTAGDYYNWNIGTIWLNVGVTPRRIWMLVNLANHVATWVELSTAASVASQYRTGDGNTAVPDAFGVLYLPGGNLINTQTAPDANSVTINVVDGGEGQVIIGNGANPPAWGNITSRAGSIIITTNAPGFPNTINLETAGVGAVKYHENVGVATPAANILKVVGDGVTIATTGAGNTITISEILPGDGITYHTQAGDAVPAAHILNVFGDGVNLTTSGAGNTVTVTQIGGGVPFKSAFNYSVALGTTGNITGDGTIVTVSFPALYFDFNGDFNGTQFTAPVDGVYFFNVKILFTRNTASGSCVCQTFIVSPAQISTSNLITASPILYASSLYSLYHQAMFQLTAGQQVFVQFQVSGGPKNISLNGVSGFLSFFGGFLIN